jgi:DNA-binding NtrC family response regulator
MASCDAEMRANGTDRATIVIVQQSSAVLELIEQALRDGGAIVFATRDPFEAFDVVRRVQVDLLILDDPDRDVELGLARDFCAIQPALRVLFTGREPLSLSRLPETVAAELAR